VPTSRRRRTRRLESEDATLDRKNVDWRGYIPAITTPFDRDGELSIAMLDDLLDWLMAEGMHGIVVAGTTGEWFSLRRREKVALFDAVGQKLAGRMVIIAGCNAYTATEAIEIAEAAHRAGFDGILLTPPPYIRPTSREVEVFYRTVSDNVHLPICVYNWPPGTGIDMDLDLLRKLAALEKVVAIKNSTSSWQHFLDVFRALQDEVRIFGVPMNDDGIDLVMNHGADGMMGAGAVLGRRQPEFFNALWRNDPDTAGKMARLDSVLMDTWFTPELTGRFGSAQAILKAALNVQGLPGGYPRKPLLPLTRADTLRVRDTLQALGVEVDGRLG
jgi:dihydrodipicolinate synthase/N-acetylneuraminate lyase